MHPISAPWKYQKTVMFFYVFQGVEKGYIGNEWVNTELSILKHL